MVYVRRLVANFCGAAVYTLSRWLYFSETVPLLETLYLRYAAKEHAPGQGCKNCVGWSEWRELEPDPIIDGRLLELKDKALGLGVNFGVIKQEATVSFPQDDIIRKKWPWERSGKMF